MPANYQQPEYIERRTRYFDGQFLKDQDFIDEQKYHIDRLRRSHKLLHIKGISGGLKVTVDNEKKTYEVTVGTAIDEQGRFIVLGENYTASFQDFTENVDLYINYNEEESDITQAGNDTSEDDQNQGVRGATRWWEKPIIKAYTAQEQNQIPPDAIYLARLTVKDGDAAVDSTPRQYSGIHLPSSNEPGPILQSAGDTAPSLAKLTGSLSISEQLGVGTVSSGIDLAIGDNDTGLNQEGENQLAIYTNNQERLRVDASGNVGIGTVSSGIDLAIGDSDTGLNQEGENQLAIYTSNQERLRVDASGNIGIGTVSAGIDLAIGDSDTGLNQEDENQLAIYTNNQERLRVDVSGNIGIGTNIPTEKVTIFAGELALKINDNTQEQGILFQNSGNAYTWRIYRANAGSNFAYLNLASGLQSDYANLTDRLKIDQTGNICLGTDTPDANYKLDVNGNTNINGTIYRGGNPLIYENYEIYLRGSAQESTEGNNTYLGIAHVSISMNQARGLNTVILNPNGSYKNKITHDVYGSANNWNTWANWINDASNVANGDVVAVASFDAIRNAPTGGSAETLLRAINALRAFAAQQGSVRSPYALLFIKGQTGAIEVSQLYQGPNAHLKTTYYELFNYGNSSVVLRGMIIMWSGSVDHIPHGWGLCDGNNGTPNLQDRFIVGAGSKSYPPGETGGAATVTLTIDQIPSHNHNNGNYKYLLQRLSSGGNTINKLDTTKGEPDLINSGAIKSVGGDKSHENRPPYYALCYIMKL